MNRRGKKEALNCLSCGWTIRRGIFTTIGNYTNKSGREALFAESLERPVWLFFCLFCLHVLFAPSFDKQNFHTQSKNESKQSSQLRANNDPRTGKNHSSVVISSQFCQFQFWSSSEKNYFGWTVKTCVAVIFTSTPCFMFQFLLIRARKLV